MTVFITHKVPGLDYSQALRWGAPLLPVFSYAIHPDDPASKIAALLDEAKERLADFDHRTDFLLLSGAPEAIAAATMILARYGENRIACLKWDREGSFYYRIMLDLERNSNEAVTRKGQRDANHHQAPDPHPKVEAD